MARRCAFLLCTVACACLLLIPTVRSPHQTPAQLLSAGESPRATPATAPRVASDAGARPWSEADRTSGGHGALAGEARDDDARKAGARPAGKLGTGESRLTLATAPPDLQAAVTEVVQRDSGPSVLDAAGRGRGGGRGAERGARVHRDVRRRWRGRGWRHEHEAGAIGAVGHRIRSGRLTRRGRGRRLGYGPPASGAHGTVGRPRRHRVVPERTSRARAGVHRGSGAVCGRGQRRARRARGGGAPRAAHRAGARLDRARRG